jgi:hypothetical protein
VKDNELRELLARIESKIDASTATVVGGDPKEVIDRLSRIQEVVEAGRHFETQKPPVQPFDVRWYPIVGMLIGALIFAAGMFVGTFLK